MTKFKVTTQEITPTYESMLRYGTEIDCDLTTTAKGAFYVYTHNVLVNAGYVLNLETLELFEVFRECSDNNPKNQTAKNLNFGEKFIKKLEKPMTLTKYKVISSEILPTYENLMKGFDIDTDSVQNAYVYFYLHSTEYKSKSCYVLNTENLELFEVFRCRNLYQLGYKYEVVYKRTLEKPKMNIYKIIPNQNKPKNQISYEYMMSSCITVEADSPRNAFHEYCGNSLVSEFGYAMDINSLDLYLVSNRVDKSYTSHHDAFVRKLEKPMNTYRIISEHLSPTYKNLMSGSEVKASDVKEAWLKFVADPKRSPNSEYYGYVLNIETLDLDYMRYYCDDNRKVEVSVHNKGQLEKPEPEMNIYKYRLSQDPVCVQKSNLIVESSDPSKAVIDYLNQFGYSRMTVYAMDLKTSVIYRVIYKRESNGRITTEQTIYKPYKSEKEKPMNNLSFKTLAEANLKRLPLFKNSKGEPAHSKSDGSDWSHAEWLQAVIGELGEYANIMKKVQRGDLTMEEAKPSIEKELADVQTYLSILALRLDVDLGQVTQDKFNEVSDRVKCGIYIHDNQACDILKNRVDQKLNDSLKTMTRTDSMDNLMTQAANKFLGDSKEFESEEKYDLNKIRVKGKKLSTISAKPKSNDALLNLGYGLFGMLIGNLLASNYHKSETDPPLKDLNNEKDCSVKCEDSLNSKFSNFDQLVNTCKFIPNWAYYNFAESSHTKSLGFIELQCLSSLRKYRFEKENVSAQNSTILEYIGQEVIGNDSILSKILINGNIRTNKYELKIGDMLQFSDERNVLYSLRVIDYFSK